MRSTCMQRRTQIGLELKGSAGFVSECNPSSSPPFCHRGRVPGVCAATSWIPVYWEGKKEGIQDNREHKGPRRGPALTRAPITASTVCILSQTQLSGPHTPPSRKHLPLYTDPIRKRGRRTCLSHPRGRLSGLIPGPRSLHLELKKKKRRKTPRTPNASQSCATNVRMDD